MLGPLGERKARLTEVVGHNASGSGKNLPRDQVRDKYLFESIEIVVTVDAVIFVATVRVARGVSVVLEQIDVTADAFFEQLRLGELDQVLENCFASFVLGNDVTKQVTFGGGVLGMAADVQVQTAAVF